MIVFLIDLFYFAKNRLFRLLNHKKNLKSDLAFLDSLPRLPFCIQNSKSKILLVELNDFHFELLDSIIYYFESLGYEIDVVVRTQSSYQNAIKLDLSQILGLLRDTSKYDFVFLNTMFLSLKTQHHVKTLANINAKYGVLGIYHTISDIYKFGDIASYKEGRIFTLRKMFYRGGVTPTLSCSKEVDIKFSKNDIATFVSIGFPLYHRNFRHNLYKTIEKLLKNGIKNFRFILIGRSEFKDLRFRNHISFFLNPTTLELNEILKSHNPHYTLMNFDDFAHKHYLYDSTSGLRQFSLMYNLPFVINKKFGESFGFDKSNAIFYDSNLYEAIYYAIKIINTDKYWNLKSNLHNLNEKLNYDSIALLKSCILKLKDKG